ncbi:MAG: hypothetical protein IT436_05160 [Phycisphaerales bacterium]|nr:hypothetical protein [Phycisphaerales bacterium]
MKLYKALAGGWAYYFSESAIVGITGEPGRWRVELVNGKTYDLPDATARKLLGPDVASAVERKPVGDPGVEAEGEAADLHVS